MRVTRLKLANVRAIKEAEFTFQPGFNLIVGVNGVGKTTVLEAISRGLAEGIAVSMKAPVSGRALLERDIRNGAQAAAATLAIELGGRDVQITHQCARSSLTATRPGELTSTVDTHARGLQRRGRLRKAQREAQETTSVAGGVTFTPDEKVFRSAAAAETARLLAVYFSTVRAFPSQPSARKKRAARAPAAAYVDAFTGRELRLGEFAEWVDVLERTGHERADAGPMLASLNEAVQRFLPGYKRVRASTGKVKQLLIDQSDRESLTANRLPVTDRQRLLQVLRAVVEHMSTNWPPKELLDLSAGKLAARSRKERERVAEECMQRFMDDFAGLAGPLEQLPDKVSDEDLTKGLGKQFHVERLPRYLEASQLSDGERGLLALVLDLTRRLAQANPGVKDPAANASAVVLIDELELHLHPRWQRSVVANLTRVFPKCQFIATTHSPQVIGEVAHERIQIIADGEVYSPSHSFGVDSSRVLEEIMGAAPRTSDVADLLAQLSRAVGDGKFKAATKLVDKLAGQLGEDDPEVTRARTLLGFMEGDK